MSSIQAFGDIHGRDSWKFFVDERFDQIVFIGDYFDNEEIDGEQQIDNFLEILDFKKRFPHKVTLLLGNHDYHYLDGIAEPYVGWQEDYAASINRLLEENMDYMQICKVIKNTVFSHAGITETWCRRCCGTIPRRLGDAVNKLFATNRQAFDLHNGSINGAAVDQSPIWVRPAQLMQDRIKGYNYVVGHTKQQNIEVRDHCAFIDVQGMPFEAENIERFDWDSPYSF